MAEKFLIKAQWRDIKRILGTVVYGFNVKKIEFDGINQLKKTANETLR